MLDAVNDLILDAAGHPWVYALVALLAMGDAFVPPLPSESAIVALAALGEAGGVNLWLLGLVGACGAVIGDSTAFFVGRKVGITRFAWQRKQRTANALSWAGKEIEKRGGMLIFTARYIPVGRVAVMLTAGATGMPWRRFIVYSAIGCSAWSTWSVIVGAVAGEIFEDQPLLAAIVGIVIAITVGMIIDRIASRRRSSSDPGATDARPDSDPDLEDRQVGRA